MPIGIKYFTIITMYDASYYYTYNTYIALNCKSQSTYKANAQKTM